MIATYSVYSAILGSSGRPNLTCLTATVAIWPATANAKPKRPRLAPYPAVTAPPYVKIGATTMRTMSPGVMTRCGAWRCMIRFPPRMRFGVTNGDAHRVATVALITPPCLCHLTPLLRAESRSVPSAFPAQEQPAFTVRLHTPGLPPWATHGAGCSGCSVRLTLLAAIRVIERPRFVARSPTVASIYDFSMGAGSLTERFAGEDGCGFAHRVVRGRTETHPHSRTGAVPTSKTSARLYVRRGTPNGSALRTASLPKLFTPGCPSIRCDSRNIFSRHQPKKQPTAASSRVSKSTNCRSSSCALSTPSSSTARWLLYEIEPLASNVIISSNRTRKESANTTKISSHSRLDTLGGNDAVTSEHQKREGTHPTLALRPSKHNRTQRNF